MADAERGPFIESLASELRRPVRLDARFDARVMEAIEAPDVIPLHPQLPRVASSRPWFLQPLTISVSPVGAMAIAAGLIGLVAIGIWQVVGTPSVDRQVARGSEVSPAVLVANSAAVPDSSPQVQEFRFLKPGAHRVMLVGSFNDWDVKRTPMARVSDDGIWTISIPLAIGRHTYQFLVDDSIWVNDPSAATEPSQFGSANSVLTIVPRMR